MLLQSQIETTIVTATLALAVLGALTTFASRLLLESNHGTLAAILFFGSMVLVASTTLLALGVGSSCWITGSGSLLFMCLIGTIAPRPNHATSL